MSEVIVLLTTVSHDCNSARSNNPSRISSIVVISNKSKDVDTSDASNDSKNYCMNAKLWGEHDLGFGQILAKSPADPNCEPLPATSSDLKGNRQEHDSHGKTARVCMPWYRRWRERKPRSSKHRTAGRACRPRTITRTPFTVHCT